MTVTAEGLIDTMVWILMGCPIVTSPATLPTLAAAADIQPYRAWSIQTLAGAFNPKITFELPRERKEIQGKGGGEVNFKVTAFIRLHAFVSGKSTAAPGVDGGETRVRQALTQIRRQIEVAIIDNQALWLAGIQTINVVDCAQQGGSDGNGVHLGELLMQFEIEFYQGPEDFAQLDAPDLEDLHIDVTNGDDTVPAAGLDITLPPNT